METTVLSRVTPETLLRQTASLMTIVLISEDGAITESEMITRIRRVANAALKRS